MGRVVSCYDVDWAQVTYYQRDPAGQMSWSISPE